MSKKRYYFKQVDNGYGYTNRLWDEEEKRCVNVLIGDSCDMLNKIHEQQIQIDVLTKALEIEQRAGMELARKLLTK